MFDDVDQANLIIDPPAPGAWNMAVDQALLMSAEQFGQATLRFYRWEAATLSLGYFQKLSDRGQHLGSANCPAVRRTSGGGAIVHDQELTFSLAFPSDNRWSKKNNDLYRTVHGCIVDCLQSFGVRAAQYEKQVEDTEGGNVPSKKSSAGQPTSKFLCFQRRTDGDIVLDGHKVGGSAQRRSKSAILQHTSLLLRKSPAAQELPGIEDLAGAGLEESVLVADLAERLSSTLLVAFRSAKLTLEQKEMSERIIEETFGNSRWLAKK